MNNVIYQLDNLIENREGGALIDWANENIANGNKDENNMIIASLNDKNSNYINRLRIVGILAARVNKIEMARNCFKLIFESGQGTEVDLFQYASYLMHFRGLARHLDQHFSALKVLRLLTKKFSNNAWAWLSIGQYLLDELNPSTSWHKEAFEAFSNAKKLRPDWTEAQYGLAMIYQAQHKRDEAIQHYLNTIKINPKHAAAHFRLRTSEYWKSISANEKKKIESLREMPPNIEDITVADCNNSLKINSILEKHGYVIVKSVIPGNLLDSFKTKYQNKIQNKSKSVGRPQLHTNEIDSNFATDWLNIIRNTKLRDIICNFSSVRNSGWTVTAHDAWQVQFRQGKDKKPNLMHQDFPVSESQERTFVTCWIPLTICDGVKTSTLKIFRENFKHPIHLEELLPNAINAVPESLITEYLNDRGMAPSLKPGDLVMFGPNIFHATQVVNENKNLRISIDFRFRAGPTLSGINENQSKIFSLPFKKIIKNGPLYSDELSVVQKDSDIRLEETH